MAVIGALVAQLSLDFASFTRDLTRAGDALDQAGRRMTTVGRNISTYVSAPLVGFGALALKTAADFEEGMNRVAAVSGATAPELKQLREEAQRLGASVELGKFSARDAAEGMGFLAQAGFKANQIIGAMPGTLQLASAAQIGLAESADIVTNILTGYGKTVEELAQVNDVLVKAFTSANVNLTQLGEAMKFVGPVAQSAGVQFEEAAAAIALMGNAGIQGEMAGTALRGAISHLVNPTKQAAKTMKELGLSFVDADDRMRPLVEVLAQLEHHADDAGLFMELFGQRAGPAMAALVGQGASALAEFTDTLENSGGKAAEVASIQMRGFATSLEGVKSSFEALQIAIAESGLLDFVDKLARRLANVLQELSELDPQFLRFATVLAGVAAAIGPIILALGGMTMLLGAMLTPLGLWVTAFVGGSVAIVTALVAVWDHTQRIGSITFRVGDVMIGVWETVKTSILGVLQGMGQLAEAVFRFVKGDFSGAMEAWQSSAEGFAASLTAPLRGWEAFKSSIEDSERARQEVDALADTMFGVGDAADAVKSALSGLDLDAALVGLGEAASSALRPFEDLEIQVSTLRQQAALLREGMREPLAGSVIGAIGGLEDIARAEQMMRDWASQNDLVGASYDEIAAKIGRTRGEIAATLRSARELQTFIQAGTQLAEQQQQQALLLQFSGEETEEYRVQLRMLQLKAQMGDVLAGQLLDQVRLVEQQSAALKQIGKGRDIEKAIDKIKLSDTIGMIQDPAWKEFAETLDQIGVRFEVIAGEEIQQIEVLDQEQLELANELFDVIQRGGRHVQEMEQKSRDLTQTLQDQVDQQSLLLRFSGEETAEYQSQLRVMEAKKALGGDLNAQQLELLKILDQQGKMLEMHREAQEEAAKAAELMLEPFKNAIRNIQAAFTDMFEGIFSGGIDSFTDLAAAIKRIFIRLAAEIATLMVIRPVLGNVMMSAGMGGLAQQMGMVGGGGLSAMGPLGATMSTGFSTVTNAINNLGTSFGFASGRIGPAANPWGGAIGGFNFGARAAGPAGLPWAGAPAGGFRFAGPGVSRGIFGGQTLGGFLGAGAMGAGLGALGGSMFGLSKQGTIGSSIGGGLGGAIGSIIPGVGMLAGGLGGSLLGGLVGSLFKSKPSDKGQATEINLLTGAVKEWGQTGKKFSQENRAAATTFASSAADLANTLKALTGGTLSGGLKITVGSREGMRVGLGDEEFGRTKDPKEFASLITQAIASSLKGVGGIQGQILKRADMSTPESLIADLEFGRVFEELTRQARPLTDQLNALKGQFMGAREQAKRLGLDVGLLKDRQKEAITEFRSGIMTELRGLAGEISPIVSSFNELRDRFRAVSQEAKAIGLNRNEVKALQEKALGSFREGILNELRGLATGANSVVQAFEAMREQFRAVRRDARAIGLNRRERDEVKALQQQAIGSFRQGIMNELRSLAGAATPAVQAFRELREQFVAARRDARAIGLNRRERNEIKDLQQQAIRSFREGIVNELRGLASDATPVVQAFKDMREQFRSANRDAAAIGLNRNEIRRLRDQAISNFRQDFITNLEQSAGGPNNFITQMEELTKHFEQARKDARGIGVSVSRVNQIQARAVENLQTAFMDEMRGMTGATETFADQIKVLSDRFALAAREAQALGLDVAEIRRIEAQAIQNLAKRTLDDLQGQLTQQAQAMRDHFRGILDPLRDFRQSLDFGSLSANAPAEQFQLAQSQFQLLAQQAANNNAKALADIPRAAQAFIEQAMQFGASPAQAQAVKQVQQVFDRLIAQQERAETEFTRDLPDAIDDSAEKQVKALREEIDRLVVAIGEVKRELQRNQTQKRVA